MSNSRVICAAIVGLMLASTWPATDGLKLPFGVHGNNSRGIDWRKEFAESLHLPEFFKDLSFRPFSGRPFQGNQDATLSMKIVFYVRNFDPAASSDLEVVYKADKDDYEVSYKFIRTPGSLISGGSSSTTIKPDLRFTDG